MKIFESGIVITNNEQNALKHLLVDPEQTIKDAIVAKASSRRSALVHEWEPTLYADDSVTSLPKAESEVAALIFARDDYQTRLERDIAAGNSTEKLSAAKYSRVDRTGPTLKIFENGIDIDDSDANCILAYVQYLDDWVLGSLMGHIGRGKKQRKRTWEPILLADDNVATMPATEAEFISNVVARADYKPAA